MEGYSHLQAMPNSPLTPLTPLSENTKFEFNIRGDGSLDEYINSIRQEHHVEQQKKKLQEYVKQNCHKKNYFLQPKRYSKEFLKIRDVFEAHEQAQEQNQNKQEKQLDNCNVAVKGPVVKITYTTPTKKNQQLVLNYANTPTNLRTPLKPKNQNVTPNIKAKQLKPQQQQKVQQKQAIQQKPWHQQLLVNNQQRVFRQASPVAVKPICPKVESILKQTGLSMYSGIFQREEIDLFTFHLLQLQDLHQMGITHQNHCAILMHEIYYAGQYFGAFSSK